MEDKEREIDLRQLVILIMMQWRIITCAALICALFCAFIAINKSKTNENHRDIQYIHDDTGYSPEQSYEYKMLMYKKLKIYYESEIKNHLERTESEKLYIKNSISMQIDPLNQVIGIINVLISDVSESIDPIDPYLEKVRSDAFWRPLAEKYSIEPKYFREMCTIELGGQSMNSHRVVRVPGTDGKRVDQGLAMNVHLPNNRQIVQVAISMPDKNMTEEALSLLAGMFDPKNGTQLLQKYVYEHVNPDLAHFQQETYSQQAQYYNELQTMYNNYGSLTEPQKMARPGARKAAGNSGKRALLKGAVLGGLAGAGATATLLALPLLLSGRLLSYSELFDRYPLNCLAVFPPQSTRGHMFAVDRLLLQWRDNSRFSRLDRAERFDIAVENIRMHVAAGERVLLLGTIALPRIQEIQVGLADRLASCTVQAWCFVDQQLASLHEIDQYEYIILVEEVGISKFRDIENEIQTIQERGKNIIGCIII
ncbi:hypothetical protein [Desulfobulbus oralis]|uniref:Uncharacterized protein n=1 Tax=Desulfobulbus oralis TaxID=1986146 RepID=A0A2L1GN93_9BACT|nr:hypothetical protein [Desulfobulbus oralis]AVD71118.1 hypothetical protein CAY53_06160 [Desulfobulbus oralis]